MFHPSLVYAAAELKRAVIDRFNSCSRSIIGKQ